MHDHDDLPAEGMRDDVLFAKIAGLGLAIDARLPLGQRTDDDIPLRAADGSSGQPPKC